MSGEFNKKGTPFYCDNSSDGDDDCNCGWYLCGTMDTTSSSSEVQQPALAPQVRPPTPGLVLLTRGNDTIISSTDEAPSSSTQNLVARDTSEPLDSGTLSSGSKAVVSDINAGKERKTEGGGGQRRRKALRPKRLVSSTSRLAAGANTSWSIMAPCKIPSAAAAAESKRLAATNEDDNQECEIIYISPNLEQKNNNM